MRIYIYNIIYDHNYILYIDHPGSMVTILYAGTTGTSPRLQDWPPIHPEPGQTRSMVLRSESTGAPLHLRGATCHSNISNRYVYVKHRVSLAP